MEQEEPKKISTWHQNAANGGHRPPSPYVQERRDWVNHLKDVPCTDCGGRFPPVAMDFDHVKGDKISGISQLVLNARPTEVIIAEIAKCEIVCANCHRVRTFSTQELIADK